MAMNINKHMPKSGDKGIGDAMGMLRKLMWLGHVLTAALSYQGEIYLRTNFGRMWPPFGVKVLTACCPALWIAVYSSFLTKDSPDACWNFAPFYPLTYVNIALMVIHSVAASRREVGVVETIYDGEPWLCRVLPNIEETEVKRLEIMLLFLASFVVCIVSVPLGTYMTAIAVSAAVQVDIMHTREKREDESMADGKFRGETMMERQRERGM